MREQSPDRSAGGRSRGSTYKDDYNKGGRGRDWRRDGEDDRNNCDRSREGYRREWGHHRQRERRSHGEMELIAPCIWIGGCPHDITELEIERVCSKYGPVHGITLKHSARDTFAFAWYNHLDHAKDAIAGLDQAPAFGAPFIKVAPANRRVSEKGAAATQEEAREEREKQEREKQEREQQQRYRDQRGDDNRRNPSGRGSNDNRKSGGDGGDGGSGWQRRRSPSRGRRSPPPRHSPPPRQRDSPPPRQRDSPPPRQRERTRTRSRSRQPLRRGSGRQGAPRPIRVYLSQLPRDLAEDELMDITSEYGKVLASELHREGAYKCGWVEYATKAEAETAVHELDERRMDEWNMRLQAYLYPGGGS